MAFGLIDNQKPPVDNQVDLSMHFLTISCKGQFANMVVMDKLSSSVCSKCCIREIVSS